MATKDSEDQNILWNFVLDLSTIVIKSVPELSCEILKLVGVCEISNHASTNYIPVLQFYSQVFQCTSNVLEIARFICKDNKFWEKFLFPVNLAEKNKYVTKATVDCIAAYVKFSLEASKLNQKPKGCEIRVLLESNLQALVSGGLNITGSGCDIFEVLNKVMEIVEQKSLDEFLLPLIKESIDFVKILKKDRYLDSTALLRCYITTYLDDPEFSTIKAYLQSIFINPTQSLQSKKMVIVNVAKFSELSEVFLFVLEQFLENTSETMFTLCQYFFSFHTVKSMMTRCENTRIAQKLFSLIAKYFKLYSDDIYDSSYSDTFIRNLCLFSGNFFSYHDLNLFEVKSVINPIMNITKQKYEVDDFVKSDALGLFSVLLQKIGQVENLDEVVRTLCGFACDQGALNVVRDSALLCISKLLSNKSLSLSLSELVIELISCVILKATSGRDQLVKGAAVMTQTAMLEHLADQVKCSQVNKFFPSKEVDALKICDNYNEEERIEMMKLASRVHEKFEDPGTLDLVKTFVLTSLDVDTNWDVKVHSVQFWKAVYRKARAKHHGDPVKLIKHLEKHSFFTGVVLGYQDYEDSVTSCYHKFIKDLDFANMNVGSETINHALKRKVEEASLDEPTVQKKVIRTNIWDNDTNRDDEIEDILDENDTSLVNCLTERSSIRENLKPIGRKALPSNSVHDFLKFQLDLLNPQTELSKETVLESVLDEIIQSSSDESQIDMVDCY
eukprot:TRINITY_DN4412_c0_g1_i1.p1 TRINITY_DN4412_c0_g1~~TRINITY_DN4412_c0_g1_i1.p1  ORF type:complete len:805 (+),score=202.19 TRINITY_DN4412_c0_g1_i1:232-2415(+)